MYRFELKTPTPRSFTIAISELKELGKYLDMFYLNNHVDILARTKLFRPTEAVWSYKKPVKGQQYKDAFHDLLYLYIYYLGEQERVPYGIINGNKVTLDYLKTFCNNLPEKDEAAIPYISFSLINKPLLFAGGPSGVISVYAKTHFVSSDKYEDLVTSRMVLSPNRSDGTKEIIGHVDLINTIKLIARTQLCFGALSTLDPISFDGHKIFIHHFDRTPISLKKLSKYMSSSDWMARRQGITPVWAETYRTLRNLS